MECSEARELFLEQDLNEVKRSDDSALAAHLHSCPACRRRIEIINEAESALASSLEGMVPSLSFEESIAADQESAGGLKIGRFRPLPLLLPMAVAALLFILLLPTRNREVETPIERGVPGPGIELPAVKVPRGKTAIILDSGNPDYQIIWLFDEEGE